MAESGPNSGGLSNFFFWKNESEVCTTDVIASLARKSTLNFFFPKKTNILTIFPKKTNILEDVFRILKMM